MARKDHKEECQAVVGFASHWKEVATHITGKLILKLVV